jgi:DNA polymerase III epsilon subunit-like protein
MRILFFDMEFANGQVPGSIYSLGYLMTDENFEIIRPQTDLIINPDSTWNDYVAKNILAYPMEVFDGAPKFPEVYEELKALFEEADIAVGFSVSNDTRALKKDCERYGLSPISFFHFDTERLCRLMEEHKNAHGLSGCVRAWCGIEPENQHRSDGDALATMHLMRAICRDSHIDAEMLITAFPECAGDTIAVYPPQKRAKNAHTGSRRRHHHRSHKKPNANAQAGEKGETK